MTQRENLQKKEKKTVRNTTRGTRTNRVRRSETKVEVDVVVTESVSEAPVVEKKREITTPFDFWMGIYGKAFSNYADMMVPTRVLMGLRVLGDDYSGHELEDEDKKVRSEDND